MNEAQYVSLFNKLSNLQEDLAELRAYVASREILQRNEILSLVNDRTVALAKLEEKEKELWNSIQATTAWQKKYHALKENNNDESI